MNKSEMNLPAFATSNPMLSSVTEEFRPEVDSEMSLLSYWAILRKHLILVAFCGVVGAITAVFYTSRLPNMYRAGASVAVIKPTKNTQGLPVNQTYYSKRLSTQVAILQSRAMAKKVIERLPEAICLSFFGRERTDVTAGQLLRTISVAVGDGTDILYITCRGKNAENVAYIANLYVDVFVDENEREIKNAQDKLLNWLKQVVPNLEKKIREKRDILIKLQQEYPEIRTYNLEKEGRAISRVEAAKSDLYELERSMYDVKLRYGKCQEVKKKKSLEAILSSDLFVQNAMIDDLQKKKFLYENQLRDLKTRYKPAHPSIKKTINNIAQVKKQIFHYAKRIIMQEEEKYENFKSRRAYYQKKLKELEEQNLAFHQKILMYEDINAEVAALRDRYNDYREKMKEYDSQRSYQFDILNPIDSAGIPGRPFSPNRTQNYLVGTFLGVMLGVIFVFLIEFLDQSIKTVEEVQQLTPARIMGFIPFISPKIFMGKTTHVVEEKENTNVAEAFRAISTSIFFAEEQTKNKTFVITSALAQDGKTTIFCNLALMMAKAGHKVLLIDGDLRRPRLRRLFELPQGEGFTELLRRDVSSEEVVHKINENLSCITSGKIPADPYETIHNSHIKELIRELEHEYDYILIDAPPIGITTDALLLGKKLGGLLFAITVHRTPKRMVKQLIHRMQTLDIELSGLILNDVKGSYSSQLSYYNYYGLYYSKSYYTRGLNKNPLGRNSKINPLVDNTKKS
ncbi:GumC family protein [Candidatus Uabimicrobium amorphum]|uniref:non-specific protein-tyrosine kinase n=1 Tax=Uabimicrobium amorphum TaxID=2596890 RepID=A0A5S9IPR9_UABAM|nr:polysaccharide biosynthesis tyrosine autokinase [Candidatus Uabimicrobium amorphum]BBM85431.1 chain-length determining protein [Candidatus Uabimicrobium amorphum]